MATPQLSLSQSLIPQQQAMHIAVFGLLFAFLASPYVIKKVSSWFPSLNLSENGVQLTPSGLFVHALVFMAIALFFASYNIGTTA